MTDKRNYTIIRLSGRTNFYEAGDYFAILSGIAHEYGSAGSNWDRPNILLENGKVVVGSGIADIAWNFGQRNRELHAELDRKIREEFQPAWFVGGKHD